MSGQWYQGSNDNLNRASKALTGLWHFLAQPERARRVRQAVVLLLLVWVVYSLAELIWLFLPRPETSTPAALEILNPVESRIGTVANESLDVDTMLSWHLFGVVGENASAGTALPETDIISDRDGIEKGARETRLDLKLRGVISASEDGLGHAIIEQRSKQEVYAVGDKLPLGNKVTLAKVLPGSVVLDNNGTYELLSLFDDTALLGQLPEESTRTRLPKVRADTKSAAEAESANSGDNIAVARNFRRQVYENPQSLAQVVRVSAVREGDGLRGYRVDPGKKSAQFSQLGFKSGDIITSVNGISLDNPGNTMKLYQLMRSASEAVFDLQRGGENLTLTVSLDAGADGG